MFWLISSAIAAPPGPLPTLRWDWSESRRYFVQTEVQLPVFMWFRGWKNSNIRVVGFQLQAVLNCKSLRSLGGGRKEDVSCLIEDLSLAAGVQPGDEEQVFTVLEEFDEVLTGTVLQMVIRRDGRVLSVELPMLRARNYRTRARNETLRQLMRFVARGFELPLDTGGEDIWATGQSLVCSLPGTRSMTTAVDAIHTGKMRGDLVEFASHARGLMVAADDRNFYTCETTARGFVDPNTGGIKHTWEMYGEPTPSSPIALGAAGYPYLQRGALIRLDPDEHVVLRPTGLMEAEPVGTAIQQAPSQGGFDVED